MPMRSLSTEDDWAIFTIKLRPKMVEALDAEAAEIGVSRSSLIKLVLAQHLASQK